MKFTNQLKILITLLASYHALGQNANPSVGGAMKFDSYPIDLSSGMPDVSIPLYTSPTRSKDVSINFNLRYHPSSVSKDGKNMGNCGSGWSISPGGAITRIPSTLVGTFYQFNFMGLSGKFKTGYDFFSGAPVATLTESNGVKPLIEVIAGSGNSVIAGFIIYDDLGYKYTFMEKDITYEVDSGTLTAKDNNFQLSEIYDNNNNLLVTFEYEKISKQITFGSQGKLNTLSFLSNIIISGYGNIELEGSHFDSDKLWIAYNSIVVKDVKGNTVQSFNFTHNVEYLFDGSFKSAALTQVNQQGGGASETLTYKLFYKPFPTYDSVSPYTGGYDEYGYYTTIDKNCEDAFVDPKVITSGILEKMVLPTGGCIIYNYEANNYSDLVNGPADPNFYYELNENEEPKNIHNYNRTILGKLTPGNNILALNFTQDTRVFFKFNGAGTLVGGLEGGLVYPSFTLWNNTQCTHCSKYEFGQWSNNGSAPSPWGNCNNFSKGVALTLNGNYTLETAGGTLPYGEAYILTPKPVSELQRWWYGGGIRIKAIAYFTDSSIPQDYFSLSPDGFPAPSKITNYKYNLFSDPKYSSGTTKADENGGESFIYYSNVAVYEGQGLGRTEYTFLSPVEYANDIKVINKKVYNEAGELQLESIYDYEWRQSYPVSYNNYGENMGWFLPKEQVNVEYYPEGRQISTKETFLYDANNKIIKKTSSNSRNVSYITNTYYTDPALNSSYSKNRIEFSSSEQYLGTTLLSTTKTEYLNNWTDTAGSNVSYLPSEIKTSKGSGALEVKSKINRYDRYGHILEAEKPGGIKTSFIWAYNNTQIVAEIVNISYSAIPQSLITNIQAATDTANPSIDLNTALTNLRNATELADALITTYTFKPLVGILTKTDARGYKISYEYDSNNRQVRVKDQDGNIISENVYHTKPQN